MDLEEILAKIGRSCYFRNHSEQSNSCSFSWRISFCCAFMITQRSYSMASLHYLTNLDLYYFHVLLCGFDFWRSHAEFLLCNRCLLGHGSLRLSRARRIPKVEFWCWNSCPKMAVIDEYLTLSLLVWICCLVSPRGWSGFGIGQSPCSSRPSPWLGMCATMAQLLGHGLMTDVLSHSRYCSHWHGPNRSY